MKDSTKFGKIDFNKLINFYTLYREGSVSKATASTGIPAHTYYYDLRILEEVLDTKLYIGGKKNFTLTDEGLKLAELSRDVFNRLKILREDTNEFLKGEIVIHTTVSIGLHYLPSIIHDFSIKYPDIKLKIFSGPEYLGTRYNEFDVKIGPYTDNRIDLSQQLLKKFDYGYCASKNYINKYGEPKNEIDLTKHKILLFSGEHFLPKDIINNAQQVIETNSYPILFEMCLKNIGICSLPLDVLDLLLNEDKEKYSNIVRILPNIIAEQDNIYFSFFKFTNKEKPIIDLLELSKNYIK